MHKYTPNNQDLESLAFDSAKETTEKTIILKEAQCSICSYYVFGITKIISCFKSNSTNLMAFIVIYELSL